MRNAMIAEEPLSRLSRMLSGQAPVLLAVSVLLVSAGMYLARSQFELGLPLIASGATLASLAGLGRLLSAIGTGARRRACADLRLATGSDPVPCLGVSPDGLVWFANPAAAKRFTGMLGQHLAGALSGVFADPVAVFRRIQDKAAAVGAAHEDAVTRGGSLRLTVVDLGPEGSLWRFDEAGSLHDRTQPPESDRLPMLVVDEGGAVSYANGAMQQLLGQKVKNIDRVLTEFPLPSGGLQTIKTADGNRLVRVALVAADNGRQALYFLSPDTDETHHAEGPGATTEDLPVGLLELEANGRIITANRLAREMLQLGEGADLGEVTLSDRLEGLGRPVRDWLDEAAKGRGLVKPEVLRVRSDENESFLKIALGAVSGRGPVRLLAVLNDATELKTLEAQFVQSQKMQAIGQLAGGVAHDFNNLLTAISGHCDLMLLRHDHADPDYGDLVQIHQNANRAASLVGQLLAFSRKQTLQPQIIDLRDTLSDLTHLLNRLVGERIKLTLHHEVGLPTIRADRRQLEQVIMNLVVNARDAMSEGGEIRIETMERILGDGLTRDRAKVPPGRYVVVKVEDHGSGIAPDMIGKIFEPFYTTKRPGEGTGLGLSMAYGIVKQSDGFIFADSVVGSGTVFTLYFPAHDLPAEARAQAPKATAARMARAGASGASPPVVLSNPSGGSLPQHLAMALPQLAAEPANRVETGGADPLHGADRMNDARVSDRPIALAAVSGDREAATEALVTSEPPPVAGEVPSATVPRLKPVPKSPEITVANDHAHGKAEAPERLRPEAASARSDTRSGDGGGVILLVEDEAPVRAFASRALRMRGYTVIEAENAEEALATLEDSDLKVDVFLTDVIMPGMDGPTWVRRALTSRPDVKVIFVSGYAEDSFGEAQARIPNSVFLPKPFSLSELTATVQDQLL